MGGTKEGDFEGNTPSQIMAAERNWIEEQDKNLPIVIMKTASECFKREFCKIRAEAKEKFIAKSIAKFGKEKLEEIEELANAILKYTKIMKSKKMVLNKSENSMKYLFDDNDNEADDELVDI
jgi:hypothetical protein